MNMNHNNGENDKSLNGELDSLGHAYRQLEQDEPPELLDQAILNSAHRAVEKKPHWMKFGWLHGLTTAAVFVLAFTVIVNQPDTQPTIQDHLILDETVAPGREKLAKKQLQNSKSDDADMERKELGESRQQLSQDMPSAASADAMTVSIPAEAPVVEVSRAPRSMADTQEADTILGARLPEPAAAMSERAPVASDAEESAIEQTLANIIELKRSGNEAWREELAAFKDNYPDYPLPDELRQ